MSLRTASTTRQEPCPAIWTMGRQGPCCLPTCNNPSHELKPCYNRSKKYCNNECHHWCAEPAGLAPDDDEGGIRIYCSVACRDSANTDDNNDGALPEFPAEEMERLQRIDAARSPIQQPPPRADSPVENVRDEDLSPGEIRNRCSLQGQATYFQRVPPRAHDESHIGGAHGRQAGIERIEQQLERPGRADGLKCGECGKDCPTQRTCICPGDNKKCLWSMHPTCGLESIVFGPRYRCCSGCPHTIPEDELKRTADRDEASRKCLTEHNVKMPGSRKRKSKAKTRGSSRRSKTSTGGSRNNNNNNNDAGTIGNNDGTTGNTTTTNNNNNDRASGNADNNNNNNADSTTNNTGRRTLSNPTTAEEMRNSIVDPKVHSRCVNEIIHFMQWSGDNYPDWLTDYALEKQKETLAVVAGEKTNARRKRIKDAYLCLVENSPTNNVIVLDKFTPKGVMECTAIQANQFTGKKLSVQGYAGKRSSIKHLVRCQCGDYWSAEFERRLEILWKGFTRANNPKHDKPKKRHSRRRQANNQEQQQQQNQEEEDETDSDDDSDDDRDDFKSGKSCMTTELHRAILHWFLAWGTLEGIMCACYVCLTWHLACRSHNTAKVKFSHMSWTYFDAMHINFAHTKTEQHGQAKRHKRAVHSNTYNWEMDFPMLLGLWLSVGFNSAQRVGDVLFPGGALAQKKRVGDLLKQLLLEHENEVLAMGYDLVDEIGLHSIRKGVSTYLASLPGGPAPAALCLRAGWSMGKVKDIYFHQTQGGDEFVGRCAAMLNLMNGEFASSPAFFKSTFDNAAKKEALSQVFPHFKNCAGMERILDQCLASMVYHREEILKLRTSHTARLIHLYQDADLLAKLKDHVTVTNAWDAKGVEFTGIPPHIKSLVDIAGIKQEQSKLVQEACKQVMEGMKGYFEEKQMGGSQLTERTIQNMISQSLEGPMKTLGEKISKISTPSASTTTAAVGAGANIITTTDTTTTTANRQPTLYRAHQYIDGVMSRLPKDYQWPRCGASGLWRHWNVGNTTDEIPPLRLLHAHDYGFMDTVAKTDDEKRGSKGKCKDNKRPARKVYCEIKFLCNYIEERAKEKGLDVRDRSISNVQLIFEAVTPSIHGKTKVAARDTQLKWTTIAFKLRRRLAKERKEEEKKQQARNAAARAASTAAAAALTRDKGEEDDNSYNTEDSRKGGNTWLTHS